MLVAIIGQMGSGKTLLMSILSEAFFRQGLPIFATYSLENAERLDSVKKLLAVENGVLSLDEFWITLDSRDFGNSKNISLTHWVNMTRKKNLLVMFTTQTFGQIDLRVRNAVDLIFSCEKIKLKDKSYMFRYTLVRGSDKIILKSFKIPEFKARNFFKFYDSFEIISPLLNETSQGSSNRKWFDKS